MNPILRLFSELPCCLQVGIHAISDGANRQVPADEIPDIQVLQTWLDGELVFKRN